MPLVRMLTSVAGTGTSPTWEIGDEVEMTPEQATTWADGVRGELIRDEPPLTPESRTAKPENTARRSRA